MSLKNSALILSFAAGMALLSSATYAIDMSSSQVIKTTGKVSVKKTTSPEFKKLNPNLKLSGSLKNLDGGDRVRTFNNSTADLALKDTCILMVKEQSIFEVPKILNQKDLINLQAQQGSILFKVAHGSNFQVQTADVICGVKGTMFSITIVDGLNTMLETPGLQLGYAFEGGTAIDVYEGEVEVIHKTTKEKTTLGAGQGLVAWISSKAKKGDKLIEQISFNPESKARELYGESFNKLKKAKFLKDFAGIKALDSYSSKLRYDNKLIKQLGKLDNPLVKKYAKEISNVKSCSSELKEWGQIINDSKGKKFHADFSRYTPLESEKSFYNTFDEVYMGNNTLAACKAANGSSVLKAEPGLSGLVITEGNGLIKMRVFNDNLDTTAEVMANVYKSGNDIITAVRNADGRLSWREPGSLEIQKVPAGDVAYVFNANTCKGKWIQAASGSINNELNSFNFSTEARMQQEKKKVKQENEKKQKNAIKKGANKLNDLIKKGGKKKWF